MRNCWIVFESLRINWKLSLGNIGRDQNWKEAHGRNERSFENVIYRWEEIFLGVLSTKIWKYIYVKVWIKSGLNSAIGKDYLKRAKIRRGIR